MKRVAIVGCGHAGRIRAASLAGCPLVACHDVVTERAQALSNGHPVHVVSDWREVVERDDVDIVVVSVPHHMLAPISLAAVRAGKHVLVEKPGAIHAAEIDAVMAAARAANVRVRVGFNHRYHPAMVKAKELCDAGLLGDLMFVSGHYGHGGFPEFDKQWRASSDLSGGGALIDQGIHLIDLSRWFLGDFIDVKGACHTHYWNMNVEDNGFLTLTTKGGQVAFLHASSTEWQPVFELEICGKRGKIEISGLGRKYGRERLVHYQKPSPGAPSESVTYEYTEDGSWQGEFETFLEDIELGRTPEPGLADARAALQIIERVYRLSADTRKNDELIAPT